MYETLQTTRRGPVEYLTLNRPDVRNAFNEVMIDDLARWAASIATDRDVRVVVLAGAGIVFCAGADVTWMARTVAYTEEENRRDAMKAAAMLNAIDTLPLPVIGRIHGAALGGGAGLAALCDVVVADESAVFGFTEVKLGILPAVISPFALAKVGRSAARELFLTGMRVSAARAREIGLAHAVVPAVELDASVNRYVNEFLTAGPEAISHAKQLMRRVWAAGPTEVSTVTAEAIATRRVSPEAQEGLNAFLEKRTPAWSAGR